MSMLSQVLNPFLYQRLCARFGRVNVVSAGEAAQVWPETDLFGKTRYRIHGGEYYVVCCPYCYDTRFRLWFSHLWGHYDPELRTAHRGAAICYNEDCLAVAANRDKMLFEVLGSLPHQMLPASPLRAGRVNTARVIGAPGRVASLNALPATHMANRYLISRQYDPHEVGTRYHLGFCEEAAPEYPLMWGRLVIPIYQNSQYVGFQGRALNGEEPRYYNPPGSTKSAWVYNVDQARNYPVIVVTEGATKVWRVGPFGVALFGKTMSMTQGQILGQLASSADFIVLYLDAEAWRLKESATLSNVPKQSPAEKSLQTLRQHVPEAKIVVVRLEGNTAPDDLTTEVNQQILCGALQARGWQGSLSDKREQGASYRLPPRRHVTTG